MGTGAAGVSLNSWDCLIVFGGPRRDKDIILIAINQTKEPNRPSAGDKAGWGGVGCPAGISTTEYKHTQRHSSTHTHTP